MGGYSFKNFKDYLFLRMGANEAWLNYYPLWINSAYRALCTKDKLWQIKHRLFIPELETDAAINTSVGQGYITTPTDALSVREIYDGTSNTRLDWMSWADYIGYTNRADSAAYAKPQSWHRRGSKIYIYPTPDATYALSVYYKKRVADLSGDSDVTVIGAEWDDVILELAHYFARVWNNEYDKAKFSKDAATEMIAGIMTTYGQEEMARREQIKPNILMTMKQTY